MVPLSPVLWCPISVQYDYDTPFSHSSRTRPTNNQSTTTRHGLSHNALVTVVSEMYKMILSTFYFIAFIVFRSDIRAGNSLSVPQYSAVPFCYTDVCGFLFVICCLLNINAAAAAEILRDA